MRIPRELSDFLGSLFASKIVATANRKSGGVENALPGKAPVSAAGTTAKDSPATTDESGRTTDRVTLSAQAVAAAPASVRQDIPPVALPAETSHPADIAQKTYRADDAAGDVKALVPVTAGDPLPSRQQAAVSAQERETPETRRMVRAVYGFPQTSASDRDSSSGTGIRIRV